MHRSRRALLSGVLVFTLFMTSMLVALADSHSNPGSMTFPSGDQASPYPSQITVSDEDTEITHLSVTISGINHTYPGDLDILLVGPQGQSTILMSDTLATYDLGNATLTFDDAAGQMPLEGQVFGRFYRPTNYAHGSGISCESTADSFPPPAPSTSYGETLSVFNGTNPNGTWSLYVVDDCSGDNGSITGGWSLDINGAGLDSHPVSILGNRFASPYPSEIVVSGEGTVVADVDVTISGIYQRYPNDLDILLVGPQGDSVILMSDVGGNMAPVALTNVTLHFDDSADVPLPTNVGIGSGTYQPTNSSTDLFCPPADNFPSPAPSGSYGEALSVFNDTDPNGTWSLYVVDDCGIEGGYITDWSLAITLVDSEPPVITVPDGITVPTDGATGAVVTYSVTASDDSGTVSTLDCDPPSGSLFPVGTTTVTCTATDPTGNETVETFDVTVMGASQLLVQLRADTIASVDHPFLKRAMVIQLDVARVAIERGNPRMAQLMFRIYDMQLKLGEYLRLVSADDATSLRTQLQDVIDAIT